MKLNHGLFLLVLVLIGATASAQSGRGMIVYEYSIDMHRIIPPEREELKSMIPQFNEQKYELIFNESESLYRIREAEHAGPVRGRGRMSFGGQMDKKVVYVDNENKEVTVREEFLGKNYIITGPLQLGPWRMGDEMMEIEGYMCMMAWHHDTIQDQKLTAWFTPDIRPFTGPDRFVSLPGTVLALDINNGEKVWVARQIELGGTNNEDMEPPSGGERITRKEYLEMMKEAMERMEGRIY